MRVFAVFLRAIAPLFFLVAALHLILGLNADALLGAKVPMEVANEPALDSQNRFYGTTFALYGVLLIICASDLTKYAIVLRSSLWLFFAGGLARLVSIGAHGMPPLPVAVLLVSELLAPLLLLIWFKRAQSRN